MQTDIHDLKHRKPRWLRVIAPMGPEYARVRRIQDELNLHTVCEEAACPNRLECWGDKTATFMILGDLCTRGCQFCNVRRGRPKWHDEREPSRVANAVKELGMDFAVVTSVTRDDLPDGGASIFAATVREIRNECPGTGIEVLVPDFNGDENALRTVIDAHPEVMGHNIETTRELTGIVRRGADYDQSLDVIEFISKHGGDIVSKSGVIVGFGETFDDLRQVFTNLRERGCEILTIGQYLRPSGWHYPVRKYYHPDEFEQVREIALEIGFAAVASGPRVRSSYKAKQHLADAREARA